MCNVFKSLPTEISSLRDFARFTGFLHNFKEDCGYGFRKITCCVFHHFSHKIDVTSPTVREVPKSRWAGRRTGARWVPGLRWGTHHPQPDSERCSSGSAYRGGHLTRSCKCMSVRYFWIRNLIYRGYCQPQPIILVIFFRKLYEIENKNWTKSSFPQTHRTFAIEL